MVLLDLQNVMTDVLPGLPLPAGAASFVIARVQWISEGEISVFDAQAPSPWNYEDLCTLALLVSNHETTSARLMIANLLQPPSVLLPSATLVNRNDNFLRQNPFRRRKKQRRRRDGSLSLKYEHDARIQVIAFFCSHISVKGWKKLMSQPNHSSRQYNLVFVLTLVLAGPLKVWVHEPSSVHPSKRRVSSPLGSNSGSIVDTLLRFLPVINMVQTGWAEDWTTNSSHCQRCCLFLLQIVYLARDIEVCCRWLGHKTSPQHLTGSPTPNTSFTLNQSPALNLWSPGNHLAAKGRSLVISQQINPKDAVKFRTYVLILRSLFRSITACWGFR